MLIAAGVSAFIVVVSIAFIRWGSNWGATLEEISAQMTGDSYLATRSAVRTAMTRAVSIKAPPGTVWPWLAQLGRGAGWYSVDWLDNGGRTSARHLVSWIPEPAPGDATAIGYLRQLDVGRELVWWAPEGRFLGATASLVADIQLRPEGDGSRLVIRMSADAVGFSARLAIGLFQFIDSIMARRQLIGIKKRAELDGLRVADSENPETGSRDQYQLYEIVYTSGETAGVPGQEDGRHWHKVAAEVGSEHDGHQTGGQE